MMAYTSMYSNTTKEIQSSLLVLRIEEKKIKPQREKQLPKNHIIKPISLITRDSFLGVWSEEEANSGVNRNFGP